MIVGLLLLIAIAVTLFILFKKVTKIIAFVEEKVADVKDIADHPREAAYTLGATVAEAALSKVPSHKRPKKKKMHR